ncbi:unnamed protein product [Arctia plantaginis]|uniref:Uncharacterized protein n=1 Tax=Arctia plantaginis TaxID=874455 RepID=A0A8S1BKJ5_ARCPL|nr:unnamed protein product [Arctia plantaginis]
MYVGDSALHDLYSHAYRVDNPVCPPACGTAHYGGAYSPAPSAPSSPRSPPSTSPTRSGESPMPDINYQAFARIRGLYEIRIPPH